MSSILQDLRFAARRLVRDRRFTLAAVAALALGIGATSAIFTIVNAVLLRSLPFDDPDRIMMISTRDAQGREFGVSEPDFEDWRREVRTFSGISLVQMGPVNFSADDRAPDRYDGVYISWNGFSLIGTQPVIGRGFSAEDDRPGSPPVMLLSYTVWQSRYGGDRAIIGRTIRANSEPATIIGVMPPGMEFPFNSDVWLPLAQRPTAQTRAGRAGRLLMAYGRLADGMTIEQARTEMTGITGQLAVQFPDTNKGVTASRLARSLSRSSARRYACCSGRSWAPSASFFSSRARTSPICCSRARPTARARWPCVSRSARLDGASSGSCSSRACCSRLSRASRASASRMPASAGSTPTPRTSASRTGWCFPWTARSSRFSRPCAWSPVSSSAWRRRSTSRAPA